MTTTVSSGGKVTEANSAVASAEMKFALEMELAMALACAERMLAAAMSMPRVWVKRGERVMLKRPEPQ